MMHKIKFYSSKLLLKLEERPLATLLIISFVLRLIHFLINRPLWWDSHIYVGMGKYIFSSGELGWWEAFRPLLHPFLLGLSWKIGLDPLVVGKLLDLFFSLLVIYLTYKIGMLIFDQKTAFYGALLLSSTPLFLRFSGLIMSEPLAMALSLAGIYLIFLVLINPNEGYNHNSNYNSNYNSSISEFHSFYFFSRTTAKLFLAGIFLGLSFLAKFPQGAFFMAVILAFIFEAVFYINHQRKFLWLFWKNTFVKIILLSLGFFITVLPFFIFNYLKYHDALYPLKTGNWIVGTATWHYGSGWTYYFKEVFLAYPLLLFFFPYLYIFFKDIINSRKELISQRKELISQRKELISQRKELIDHKKLNNFEEDTVESKEGLAKSNPKSIESKAKSAGLTSQLSFTAQLIIVLTIIITIAYFIYVPRKEARYLVTILPLLSLCSVVLIKKVSEKLISRTTSVLRGNSFLFLCVLLAILPLIVFFSYSESTIPDKEIISELKELNITKTIISSNPFFLSYFDQPTVLLAGIDYASPIYQTILKNKDNYSLIYLSFCDLPCAPEDKSCLQKQKDLINLIALQNKEVLKGSYQLDSEKVLCEYSLFIPN
ncbi:glycosyltransferase family 39 protein [Candidatus Woesearchaeota archaeon]|nr:glycosyltransferase family 39 protein [Candidatus Woesearchaeota archaeon]